MMLQHSVTVITQFIIIIIIVAAVNAKVIEKLPRSGLEEDAVTAKQLGLLLGVGKETSTPDFIRLVAMRFIYGLASSMGVEDRLEGLFNGAFVPPNADGDIFGLGGFGGSDDAGDYSDISVLDGLFDDDGL